MVEAMIYRKQRGRGRNQGGFYHFQGADQRSMNGYGDADFVRMRDEHGSEWQGTSEVMGDGTVRYRFRDSEGNVISGIADGLGILLRDYSGNTWRGYVY